MASSRKAGASESTTTYGSGKDRAEGELSTWEAATDIDLTSASGTSTTEVLSVFKEGGGGGLWDDGDTLDGATCDATHFRVIRPASGEGHSGIPKDDGSVAGFRTTSVDAPLLKINEDHSRFEDLVGKMTWSSSASRLVIGSATADNVYIIGCIIFDSVNSGSGACDGFFANPQNGAKTVFFIDCLAHNINGSDSSSGFYLNGSGTFRAYNCTATNCDIGFSQATGTGAAINCLAMSNGTDFSGTWSDNTNMSDDATSPTVALRNASNTFIDAANDDFHLVSGDDAIDAGTDLSGDADFPFDDDINDGVMGAAKAGEIRSGTWDIGFDEIVAAAEGPTVPDDTLAATIQLASSGGMIGGINV